MLGASQGSKLRQYGLGCLGRSGNPESWMKLRAVENGVGHRKRVKKPSTILDTRDENESLEDVTATAEFYKLD